MNDNEFADRVATLLRERVDLRAEGPTAAPEWVPPGRRLRTTWLSVAAAAVLVVALAVGIAVTRDDSGGSISHSTAGASSTPRTTDPHYAETVRRVEAALAGLHLPGGAHPRDRAPQPSLRQPAEQPATDPQGAKYFVRRTGFWVAPGSPDAVLAYLGAHPPKGFAVDGTVSASGVLQGLSLSTKAGDDAATSQLAVSVEVVASGSGSAIRADASAIWLPSRDPATTITDPRSVAVTVWTGVRTPPAHRVLGAADARRLGDVINTLTPWPAGLYNCPLALPSATDVLVFETPRGRISAIVSVLGCATVVLSGPGIHDQPRLQAGRVDDTLRQLLHLPPPVR